jgi:hypothetical protein
MVVFLYRNHHDDLSSFIRNEPQAIEATDILLGMDSTQVDMLRNHVMYYHPKDYTAAGSDLVSYLKAIGTGGVHQTDEASCVSSAHDL